VLIDDLVGRGTAEPYRMLSARAEFRLRLRPDTADLRLTGRGAAAGLVGGERQAAFEERRRQVSEAERVLDAVQLSSSAWARHGFQVAQDGTAVSAAAMLTRPGASLGALAQAARSERAPGWRQLAELAAAAAGALPPDPPSPAAAHAALDGEGLSREAGGASLACVPAPSAVDTAVWNMHYRPYLDRMEGEVAELRRNEALAIPADLDYSRLQLSAEDREKLAAARPASLAAAQRIPGVTPAALLLLLQHVRRRQPRQGGGSARPSGGLGAAQEAQRAAAEVVAVGT
jgi:tRNA uridine 5-carboxymethylaminomethyl modification enzyme